MSGKHGSHSRHHDVVQLMGEADIADHDTLPDALALLERSLLRAADVLGDITQPVMAEFYRHHPAAMAVFDDLGLGNRAKLEAEMVENALYCVMMWRERPSEIAIILTTSVPHHQDTLHVPIDWYRGLIDAVITIIASSVPPTCGDEMRALSAIAADLAALVTESA